MRITSKYVLKRRISRYHLPSTNQIALHAQKGSSDSLTSSDSFIGRIFRGLHVPDGQLKNITHTPTVKT